MSTRFREPRLEKVSVDDAQNVDDEPRSRLAKAQMYRHNVLGRTDILLHVDVEHAVALCALPLRQVVQRVRPACAARPIDDPVVSCA
jgi:hypothetical protein